MALAQRDTSGTSEPLRQVKVTDLGALMLMNWEALMGEIQRGTDAMNDISDKYGVLTPRLREQRRRRAWTQEELAQLAGVHSNTVLRGERGHLLSFRTVRRLAEVLDIQVADLL